jgi:hypothetical protein
MWEQSLDAYAGGYNPEQYRQKDPWWTGTYKEDRSDERDDDVEEEAD